MRREKIIKIVDRGSERTFKIREMSATDLYAFGAEAILLFADSDIKLSDFDVDDNFKFEDIGKIGQSVASKGLQALRGITFEKAKPLLDKLNACCSYVYEGTEQVCTFASMDAWIGDVSTIIKLQAEAVKVNLNFFDQGQESPSSSPETVSIGKPHRQKG